MKLDHIEAGSVFNELFRKARGVCVTEDDRVIKAIVEGLQLKRAKEAVRYGDFQAFLKANNLPYSQARKNIRMVTALTDSKGRFLYKFLVDWNLTRLPQDILEDLDSRNGYPADDLCEMSINELRIAVNVILKKRRKKVLAKIMAETKDPEDRT